MNYVDMTPIARAVWGAYGRRDRTIASAAWLWLKWSKSPSGALTYRWLL